jgi:hypothetical protein
LRPRALDAIVEGVALWYAWQAAIVVRAIIPTRHHTRADLFVAGYKSHQSKSRFQINCFCLLGVLHCTSSQLVASVQMLSMFQLINIKGKLTKNKPDNHSKVKFLHGAMFFLSII